MLTVKIQLHFCHRPDLALSSSNHNCLLAPWDNAQAVGEIPRNYEERGAAINEQFNLLAAACWPD